MKEKPCLSIDLEVQEIERFYRCLAIENIIGRLACCPGTIYLNPVKRIFGQVRRGIAPRKKKEEKAG